MPISIAQLVLMQDSDSFRYECKPDHRTATLDPKGKVLVQTGKEEIMPFSVDLVDPSIDERYWAHEAPFIQDELLLRILRRAETIKVPETIYHGGHTALEIAQEYLKECDGVYNVISPGGWHHDGLVPYETRQIGGRVYDLPGLHGNETFWLPRSHFLGLVSTYNGHTRMWVDLSWMVRITFKAR